MAPRPSIERLGQAMRLTFGDDDVGGGREGFPDVLDDPPVLSIFRQHYAVLPLPAARRRRCRICCASTREAVPTPRSIPLT